MAWLQEVDYVLYTGIEASETPLALVGYLCYLHLGLGDKHILLVVEFNYNLTHIFILTGDYN